MGIKFDDLAGVLAHGYDSLIDVRSPAEFAEDHLPGAINLPVLSNAERARVGTIYTREDPFKAKKIGAALVARNAAAHLDGPLADKDGGWRPLIYCWRGGARSGAFASILTQIGWRAETLLGGYQTWRRLVAGAMYDTGLVHRLIVLDGNTGTAKTELLQLLAHRGQQVVDLEGLAAHRGSVFGATGAAQPSQKAFEGALARAFAAFDPARPVLVEAESSKIGNLLIPPTVWAAMKSAPRITISAPIKARAAYLISAYGDIVSDPAALAARLAHLTPFQGRQQVEIWQAMAEQGQMQDLAQQLMQEHYDPGYIRSRSGRTVSVLGHVHAEKLDQKGLALAAGQLLAIVGRAKLT